MIYNQKSKFKSPFKVDVKKSRSKGNDHDVDENVIKYVAG